MTRSAQIQFALGILVIGFLLVVNTRPPEWLPEVPVWVQLLSWIAAVFLMYFNRPRGSKK
ncbi:hypothetical protein HK107_02105 [Parvularcula sp. ZS-1/3]|uniref:Uncharacterized protein n=1 Tax=Parvularcula mediterranea TaxID=2732508 RepID=A0A7Y3RKA3_9PROT|nr:hypothetical protein [Parvularcula mediterranea]NNU15116.1 hypothetical protein [Parvularcula mediterranea]